MKIKKKNKTCSPCVNLRCFVSMKYGLAWIDPVYDIIERACVHVGLKLYRSDNYGGLAEDLLTKVYKEIDESFIVICEASIHSWFVAFELAHTMKHKQYILLLQNPDDEPVRGVGNINQSLSAQTEHIKYTLTNQNGRKELESKLCRALSAAINRCVRRIEQIAKKLWQPDTIPVPRGYVPPHMEFQGDCIITKKMWDYLIKQKVPAKPLVITSPSGLGKTAFLAKYKETIRESLWLDNQNIDERSLNDFPAVIFVIELGMMKEQKFEKWPEELFNEFIKPENSRIVPFYSLCQAGLVYLLLDALDEFGLKPGADLKALMERCKDLSDQGIKVVIACRSWFWEQRVAQYHQEFITANIVPFTDEQIEEFLGDKLFSKLKEYLPRGIPKWLRSSALMLTFIRDSGFSQFKHKTDLYSRWVSWISKIEMKEGAKGFTEEELLSFYQELAFLLAQKRDQEIDDSICRHANNRIFAGKRELVPMQTPTSKFLETKKLTEEGPATAKFFHLSINEFFVSMRLVDDFRNAIKLKMPSPSLSLLSISTVDLDFFTTTVYGYLYDKLGEKYEEELLQWFEKNKHIEQYPESMVRNLVEYIGMTSTNTGPFVADILMKIIAREEISEIIRYNAARALERIHPSAPRPHFDYTSDWGVAEFTDKLYDVNTYAIRGVGRKDRKPGKYFISFFPKKFSNSEDEKNFDGLCEKIEHRLLNILQNLAESGKCKDLQLNCSQAIVRWHKKTDRSAEEHIERIIKIDHLSEYTKKNLQTALKPPQKGARPLTGKDTD